MNVSDIIQEIKKLSSTDKERVLNQKPHLFMIWFTVTNVIDFK